jgi:ABC-2 type transport system ATP-binding protein
MSILNVEGLTKSYSRGFIPRKVQILKGIGFSVPSGTITGFLGANGAGKTTTMRCMLGLDYADSGKVEFFGQPLNVEVRKRIGFLPERPYFYEHLTGVEFLEFYAQLSGSWKRSVLRDRIDQLMKRVDLEHAKHRLLRAYSKGMLQRVGLAQSLIHDPELIVLDEPVSGLDPDGRMALSEIILETARKGTAVFFTSHLLHDAERLCERLIVIKSGVTIYEGTTQELLDRSGTEFEITYLASGERSVVRTPDQDSVQIELKRLLAQGATLLEVRRLRASLEEIFVHMAIRGKDGNKL